MSVKTEQAIRKRIILKAPVERVWDFLTRSDCLERWFHPATRDLVSAGPYEFYKSAEDKTPGYCWGEVLEAQAPRLLVYTFAHEWLGGHATRVSWTLTEIPGGTLLDLVHDGFEDAPVDVFDSLSGHCAGWDEHFVKLRERVQETVGEPA